jgi:hypothetical protein
VSRRALDFFGALTVEAAGQTVKLEAQGNHLRIYLPAIPSVRLIRQAMSLRRSLPVTSTGSDTRISVYWLSRSIVRNTVPGSLSFALTPKAFFRGSD